MIIEHARDMLKRERLFYDKMQAHIERSMVRYLLVVL